MLHDIPYLTITKKTKVYGYRRRIPANVRFLFDGKREIVKSLKTKSLAMAQVEVDRLNRWFQERIATAGYTKSVDTKLPIELVRDIHEDMKRTGTHPSQLPTIDLHSDPREMRQFVNDVATAMLLKKNFDADKISGAEYSAGLTELEQGTVWKLNEAQAKRGYLLDHLRRKYCDHDRALLESMDPDIDCDAEDYITPQVKWDETDPEVVRYRIMCGENLLPPPTWRNAVDDYVKRYKSSPKRRSELQVTKHIGAVTSQCEKISCIFPDGMDTALQDIEAEHVSNFMQQSNTKPSTKAKNLALFRAVWNSWSVHNQKQAVEGDPFKSQIIEYKKAVDSTEVHRRSFTPSELKHFLNSLESEIHPEVRMLGILAAYCGAPTGELAKLERRDVKLTAETPYLVFRAITGKDRIARSVPLVGSVKAELEYYVNGFSSEPDDLLFTSKLVKSSSDVSKRLKKHIFNDRPYDPLELVPYSLRHTFADRAYSAGMSGDFVQYVLGHRTKGSSKIHTRYGTGLPPAQLVEGMTAAQDVPNWGIFEQYDNQ